MPLTTLPNELLFETASYLSTSSLNHLLQTNQRFNSVLTPTLFARALAAVNGCVSIVKEFIAHCPDIIASAHAENEQPTTSRTPMILAAGNGHVNVVRAFIDTYQTPGPTYGPIDVYNPLKTALANHHDLVVRFLLHHLDPKYWSRIFPHAAGAGWSVLIAELLPLLTEYGRVIFCRWRRKATILHWIACNAGRIAGPDRICAILLEAGAKAYAHHKYFNSPRRMIMNYPPGTGGCWDTYTAVQKAFINGETHQIVKKWMDGVYSEEEVVWHEYDYVKNLAEQVEVKFVEAAEWF
ncbi:hypothetical protein Q9L58_004075 [Maublancomyces gigas]|uniref:F-box domain-containing protein n=1 Tax=Discina gigas TaxID=1032678 RepID=A0ABR3GMH4_9PEZI